MTELEKLRDQLEVHSLDDAIRALIRRYRVATLRAALGADKGKVGAFTEDDRGEDR